MTQHDTLTQALQQIADWDSHTTECAVEYGSNGVRDFYRNIAHAAISATQPAQAAQPVSRDVIRDVFLRNGFTIKDGCSDLKPYVYAAANALLEVAAAQPVQGVPEDFVRIPRPAFDKAASALRQYSQAPVDYHRSVLRMRDALRELTASPTPPAQQAAQSEPVKPLFAAKIAARKWAELQDAGARMQSIAFDGHKSGQPGTIDPWGVVRWGEQAAQGAGEVVRDYYQELLTARGAVQELEQKVFSQEQAIAILRTCVASHQRDMADPPAYLQDAVIKAAGLGAMAEQIAELKRQATHTPTQPAAGADVLDAKRWQLRCETLRALFPSAPSDYELDTAIGAAIAALATQPALAAQGEPLPEHADHVPEIAARLRLVARLAGCADAIPEDDRTAVGCIFSVLGNMRRALELKQAAQGAGEVVAWTSVNDALPDGEPGDPEVLFYSDDKRNPVDTAIGVYRADGWFSCGVEFVNVTHWKPKPANPSDTQPAAGADVPPAQPAPVVPEGWEIREEATWVYFKRPDGFYQAVTPNDSHQSHAQTLHMLMRAMLAATPTPPAQAAADARDAERWRMAVLIQSETLTPPDHRKNQQALNAYIKALGGGIDFQGAIDAALATHQQRQGGAAIAASGRQE